MSVWESGSESKSESGSQSESGNFSVGVNVSVCVHLTVRVLVFLQSRRCVSVSVSFFADRSHVSSACDEQLATPIPEGRDCRHLPPCSRCPSLRCRTYQDPEPTPLLLPT